MNLSCQDKELLATLCSEHRVSYEKVIKLLDTIQEYELKDRRTGIYDALREVLTRSFDGKETRNEV